MKILIADDDPVANCLLEDQLRHWQYEVTSVADGPAAWDVLAGPGAPPMAILDWQMPGVSGVELCQKFRHDFPARPAYLAILTGSRVELESLVTGLEFGADDFLLKPFDAAELRARLRAARRVLQLQQDLAGRVAELGQALAEVKQIRGLLPICAWCQKIRDGKNNWHRIESYASQNTGATFSHGICPECKKKHFKPELDSQNISINPPPARG
jgi:sigma-B regulation protein RsbU (phosphoserine phosphatase)